MITINSKAHNMKPMFKANLSQVRNVYVVLRMHKH